MQPVAQAAVRDAGKPPCVYLVFKILACYSQPARGKSDAYQVTENGNLFFWVRINVSVLPPWFYQGPGDAFRKNKKNCNGQGVLNDLSLLHFLSFWQPAGMGFPDLESVSGLLIVIDGWSFLVLN